MYYDGWEIVFKIEFIHYWEYRLGQSKHILKRDVSGIKYIYRSAISSFKQMGKNVLYQDFFPS